FGGMGSSREMVVSALAEPSMMLAVFSVALTARSITLGPAVEGLAKSGLDLLNPAHLLAFGALFVVALAEYGRIPVDNPDTHLELTMIHEGMILEYSGRGLALIEWAASAKQMIFLALLANLFIPMGTSMHGNISVLLLSLSIFLMKVLLLAAAIAVIESSIAKLRFFRVPELLGASFVLSLAALVTFYIVGG
ncbi:MAG TPA: NADH-quinone oxidoreductase subunit H, partial [Nitrospiria bacterium]|nr:NADH-quinone oxidoreductase subunit H [Nitrospiria bacterium]